MPLYEDRRNAGNRIKVSDAARDAVVIGSVQVADHIFAMIAVAGGKNGSRPAAIALDGWMGVDWEGVSALLRDKAAEVGMTLETISINTVFKSPEEIRKYKQPFITDDPGFGWVNMDGVIRDIMDAAKIAKLAKKLSGRRTAILVYGPGAAIAELEDLYDIKGYLEMTRQPLLWQMWDGKLVPLAGSAPAPDYNWKEYYYCDYYLLHRQKDHAVGRMDFYCEAIDLNSLKLVPRKAYEEILSALVKYPVKEVKIYQPGPWGAYRYRDLFDVPGLECNAWNELAGPELSILIDFGREEMLNMPFMSLLQRAEEFVGPHIAAKYPGLFPMDVWLDDGYFPRPEPAERISMPIHNHPGTDYVKRHFNEPLGRYETYYIAEAYEGANTWMGYKDDADMEAWERKCRDSGNLKVIEDWKDYVANWDSNVGDLYLIPPGTAHGHGGNQMVLEMDTCPSMAGTEYSFFTYDFARHSWDDTTKTMTGKPVKMHLDHSFDNDKFRRAAWVKEHLLAKPKVTKWTKEFAHDRYATLPEMPFHIERMHFYERGENDTQGKFLHIVTLTVGERVMIRSKADPELTCEIELFQSAVIPACFGEYEVVNMSKGFCTLVQLRWKEG